MRKRLVGVKRLPSNMTKDDLALAIARVICKGERGVESFNAYLCIRDYFLDLSMEDLLGIASQYGIKYC